MVTNMRIDLRSKMLDGILPGLLLFLLFLVSLLLVSPIEYTMGKPGVLVYALALMAISMMCLERSINAQAPDTTRALNGMAGGALAWTVVEVSNYIGSFVLESVTGGLIFIMVVLITGTIWRRGLPMGVQYFSASFVLLWGGYLVIASERVVAGWFGTGNMLLNIAGWVFLALAAVDLTLILLRSRNPQERVWGGILFAFFMILALNTFQRPAF